MPAHHRSWLLRLACCLFVFSVSATLLPAFLIPIHRSVTWEALKEYPEDQIPKLDKKKMRRGCAATDMVEGGLPLIHGPYEKRFHFDNDLNFQAITDNFIDVAGLIDTNIAKPKKDPWEFGKALHAIEDLYSHSNYVELFRDWRAANGKTLVGTIPPFEEVMLQPANYKDFIALLKDKLHTGRYPDERRYPKETNHGWFFGSGMNKDGPQRPLYEDARHTAGEAVSWYLKLYLREPAVLQQWKQLEKIQFGATL
jgi:hypothetical protein